MATPPEFWLTSGQARYDAILERYQRGEVSPQMTCEYLAELLPDAAEFEDQQDHLILAAYALVHDLSDGAAIRMVEFEALLPAR
jgi:hypothetical protein